jgi:hypothetical protein
LARLAVYLDLTLVPLDNPAGDEKPQAASAFIAAAGRVSAVKALEDVGQVLGRNADTGVMYAEASLASLRL